MTASVCSEDLFTVTPLDGGDGIVPALTTYSWLAPAVSGGLSGGAAGTDESDIFGTLTNSTNTAQTAIYTVTPKSGSCTGATFTVTVTVNPKPAITPMTSTVCSDAIFSVSPVNFTNGIVPSGTIYTWLPTTVPAGISGEAGGTGANITGTLNNSTNAALAVVYTVTPVSGTCTGDDFTVTVTVNPMPDVADMTDLICSAGSFTFVPVNGVDGIVPAGTTYSWLAPALPAGLTGGAAGSGAVTIGGTLINTTSSQLTAVYTVTPTSGSCTGSAFTVTVDVDPKPAVANLTETICSEATFTTTPVDVTNGIVPAGTTYSWPAPTVTGGITGGLPGTAETDISGTLINPTNSAQLAIYTVTPVSGGCTGSTFTVTVTVNPMPAVTDMTSLICSGATFIAAPANSINGIVPSGTTYTWGIPVATGGVLGGVNGTGANISGTLTNPGNTTETVTYTVIPATATCTGAAFEVTVTVDPRPAIDDQTPVICSAGSFVVSPVDGADGVVPAGTIYSWAAPTVSGGVSGGTSGTNAAEIAGTLYNPTNTPQTAIYNVTPKSGNCTGAPFIVTVTVDPKPAVTAMTAVICSEDTFTVEPLNVTNGLVPASTTYSWAAPAVTGGITGGAPGTDESEIFGTLANPTNTLQTATYTVTPTSGGCTGATFTVTVTVNPTPAITDMTSIICSSGTFTAIPVNVVNGVVPAGTTYSWVLSASDAGINGGVPGAGASITGTLTNSLNTAGTATYTVIPTSGSCTGDDFTVTVTVSPKPAITPMTEVICSTGSFTTIPDNITDGIVPAGTTYTWPAPVVTGGITGGAAGTSETEISGTLANPTNAVHTATYTVTPTSGSCTGSPFTVTVTVNPMPSITGMTAIICSGDSYSLTPANGTNGVVPVGTSYTWTVLSADAGITGEAGGTGPNIIGTLDNTENIVQSVVYTVTPSTATCTGATFTVTVTVNPMPAILDIAESICSAGSFLVTPLNGADGVVPAGTTYSWPAPSTSGGLAGGTAGNNAANISGTLTNPTSTPQFATYTVTPKTGSCTGATFEISVTVDPKASIAPMTASVCSGAPFSVLPVDVTNGIVPTGTTYSWSAPTVTGGLAGGVAASGELNINGTLSNPTSAPQIAMYTVTPTSGICDGTPFMVTVTIIPEPVISDMTATICSGGSFVISPVDGTNGAVPTGTTYTWAAPVVTGSITGGSPGTDALNIFGTLTNPGNTTETAEYTVTPKSGSCTGTPFTVTVTVSPKPAIAAMTESICSGGTFTAVPTDGVDGIVPGTTTYSWSLPVVSGGVTGAASGTNALNISGTLTNTTNSVQTVTYTVTPTAGSCAGIPFTVTVTVNPVPAISNMTAAICSEGTFSAIPVNGTNGVVPSGTTYQWGPPVVTGGITGGSLGSGATISGTLTNPTNIARIATYTVTPTSGTCPGIPFTVIVTVNPKAAITDMTAEICSGATFTASPLNGANGLVPSGTTYSWPVPVVTGGIIGGTTGTNAAIISGTLSNPGLAPALATYTVTPTTGGCTGPSFEITVTVNPSTGPTLFTDPVTTVCQDGPDEEYIATATNSSSIVYSASPAAAGVIDPATGIMNWSATYYGPATITAISTGLCGTTTASVAVTVKEQPAIDLSPEDKTTCEFGMVTFSVTATGDGLTYEWSVDNNLGGGFVPVTGTEYFGETTKNLQIFSALRSMNGYKYRVEVSGCPPAVTSAEAILTVNVAPEITVHPKDSVICFGNNAVMEADATGTLVTWQWYVNKGSGFVILDADTHFTGTTTKTLTITDALAAYHNWIFRAQATGVCGVPVYTNFGRLSVINPPVATLQPVARVICENGSTSFLANGYGYTGLQWEVSTDDGANYTSVTDDGITYVGAGTNQLSVLSGPVSLNGNMYRMALIGSCTTIHTTGVTLTVNPNPVVDFSAAPTINACGGVPIVLDGNPSGGTTPYAQHRWTGDVGPLSSYVVQSPTFNSQITNSYTLNYKVTDSKGCFADDDLVVIVDSPSADFIQDIDNGCTPQTVTFTKDMTGLDKFWWDFGDGSPLDSLTASPAHTYINSGASSIEYYDVKLTVRSPGGCFDTFTSMVTIYPAIDATFTASTNIICSGNPITFTSLAGASKYYWEYGDGASGYGTNVTNHLYTNFTTSPVVHEVKLTTTSFYNCVDVETMNITVMPVPLPQFSASPVSQVYNESGNPVTFTNSTDPGTWTWLCCVRSSRPGCS